MGPDVNPKPLAKFAPGKTYVLKGETLNQLLKPTLPVRAGDGLKETNTPVGKIISLDGELPILPFDVHLGRYAGEEGGYYVTVDHGLIVERDLSAAAAADSLRYYKAENRLDLLDLPTEFAIAPGQGIFVKAVETQYGQIDPTVEVILVVAAKNTKSLNYIPGVQVGVTYYKLAELDDEGAEPALIFYAGKSNIFHTSGLTADLVLESCPHIPPGETEFVAGEQLIRVTTVSGLVVALNLSVAARAYAPTLVKKAIDASTCT